MPRKPKFKSLLTFDGELRYPISDVMRKRKRGEPTHRYSLLFISLLMIGLLICMALTTLSLDSPESPLPTLNVLEVVPSQINITRVTLPPTWTPPASFTPSLTFTARPSATPTYTPNASSTPLPTSTVTVTPVLQTRLVTIQARGEWQSTELILLPGDRVEILYVEGDWASTSDDPRTGPTGIGSWTCLENCIEMIPGYPETGMVGRVGSESPFRVGYFTYRDIETRGELFLRINDGDQGLFNNVGSITMQILVRRYE